MRLRVSGNSRQIARYAALIAAGTFLAGCSSGVSRFQDGIFTGSTANQRSIIGGPAVQPYPGDVARAAPSGGYSASPSREAVTPAATASAPMQRQSLPPVASAPVAAPVVVAQAPAERPRLDATVTHSTPPRASPAAPAVAAVPQPEPRRVAPAAVAVADTEVREGWSRAGGSQITVRQGETVYNLSKRFGVPADAIMKANGFDSASQLAAGQQVVIPTYVYSRKAPVSAPDANPNVAEAKSSAGSRYDVPAERAPVPAPAPAQRVAILPTASKPKEARAEESQVAAAPVAPVAPATPAAAPARTAEAKPKPAVVTNAAAGGGYTVAAGDSLYAIAKKTGVTTAQLKEANSLSDGVLRIGQQLTIPTGGQSVVASAKAAPKKAVDVAATGSIRKVETEEPSPVSAYTPPRVAQKVITEAEQSAAIAPGATGVDRMRWPVRGRVIEQYGRSGGKSSDGIDIAVPEGTPVKAAENGVVIYAGDGLKEFGNTVLVRHENGLVTVYGHASELKVSRGEKVRRGQEIARSGMSGAADLPKLHFEVRKDSTPVDPSTYLE